VLDVVLDEQVALQLDQEQRGIQPQKKASTLKCPPSNMTTAARVNFEQSFEKDYVTETFVKQGHLRRIQTEKLKFEDVNVDSTLKACLEEHYLQVQSNSCHGLLMK
jgi:hypothetical protein